MIKISKSRIKKINDMPCLSADILVDEKPVLWWFGVNPLQEKYLYTGSGCICNGAPS